METKQFILLGPPGVGVSDQATALAQRWQLPHIIMSDLIEQVMTQATPLGVEIQGYIAAGEVIPDALVLKLLRRRLEQPDAMLKGWVLTGFPRTLAQAEALDQWWSAVGGEPITVVYLKAMTDLLISRLAAAAGPTQSVSSIRQRLTRYEEATIPLLDYYQGRGMENAPGERSQFKTINASVSAAEVARELVQLGQEETGATKLIHDEAELDALLAQEPHLVVDCMASWCGSCKQVAPMIDRLAQAYGDRITVTKIDFDVNRQITKRFALKGLPAVMFFKDGERVETLTGVKAYPDYSAAAARLLEPS
jgi:thioredoxin